MAFSIAVFGPRDGAGFEAEVERQLVVVVRVERVARLAAGEDREPAVGVAEIVHQAHRRAVVDVELVADPRAAERHDGGRRTVRAGTARG